MKNRLLYLIELFEEIAKKDKKLKSKAMMLSLSMTMAKNYVKTTSNEELDTQVSHIAKIVSVIMNEEIPQEELIERFVGIIRG